MKAVIYCRVSTEEQVENYSIPSQIEAMHRYISDNNMQLAGEFIELGKTGSILDRPSLNELRQFVKSGGADVVLAYDPDRLSRNFTHLMVLANEFEELGVELQFVTQSVGRTPEEKMLFGMKGLFAEYERVKILERTMRGIKQRAKTGKIPSGRRGRLYGYTYVPGNGVGEGVRYVNEDAAKWVREIFHWLVDEGLAINAITYRLRAMGVPTPTRKSYWMKSTVHRILANPAYIGKTYCFTKSEEPIEIPNATPAIISEDLFNQAQAQLRKNFTRSNRNGKVKYLLGSHLFCSRCGRRYWGCSRWVNGEPDKSNNRYYYCMGRRRIVTPNKCDNKGYRADLLERLVWEQVEALLSSPQAVLEGLKLRQEEVNSLSTIEDDLKQIETQLLNRGKQKERVYHAFYLTGDKSRFSADIANLQEDIKRLERRHDELRARILSIQETSLDIHGVEKACKLVSGRVKVLDYKSKRLALDALAIKVCIDGEKVSIEGLIPTGDIASTLPRSSGHNTTRSFAFNLPVKTPCGTA